MPNPSRARLTAIGPVTERRLLQQENSIQAGMFYQPPIEEAKKTHNDSGGERMEKGSKPVPVNGHSRAELDMKLGVHENLIPRSANYFLSCSAPEIASAASKDGCVRHAHKSATEQEEQVQSGEPQNNITKGFNQVNDSRCIVEIDEVPITGDEEDDLMPIMFHFDTSPRTPADSRQHPVTHPFIRPRPLNLSSSGAAGEDGVSPEGLPERSAGGSLFRPIPARIPRSVSLSPCGSPLHGLSSPIHGLSRSPSPAWSMSSLSPATARRVRGRNLSSTRNIDAILGSSPPVRIPRDPVQPLSGSISDVHSEASNEDCEEADVFPLAPRQRSSTCPENRSFKRRVRMRNTMNRPPTPPPAGADESDVEKQFSRLVIKEKLRIPTRPLPGVPESPGGKFSHSTPNLFSD